MDPENIIKENINIPFYMFEYFMQKDISGLIDETLEKMCLFHINEADGHGIIVMTKLRRHLDFIYDEQAAKGH